MKVDQRMNALREAVKTLRENFQNLSPEERQDALIEIGWTASTIDVEALDHPNQSTIIRETDTLMSEAEMIIESCEMRDKLDASLPQRVRKIVKKKL